jgi:hypothetical protein
MGATSRGAVFPARRPSRRLSPSDLRRPAGVGKKWLGGAGMTREEEAVAAAPALVSKPRVSTAVGALRQLLGLRAGAPLVFRRPLEDTLPPPANSGHIDSTDSPDRFAALEPSLSPPSRRLPRIHSSDARRGFSSQGLRRKAPGKPAASELSGSAQGPHAPADGGHTPAQADAGPARPFGGSHPSAAADEHAVSETPRAGVKLPAGVVSAQQGGQLGRALPSQYHLRAGLPSSPSRRLPGGITVTLQPVGSPRRGPDTPPQNSPRLRHVKTGAGRPAIEPASSPTEAFVRRGEGSAVEAQPAEPPMLPLRRGAKVMRFAADDSPSLLYAGNGLRVGGPPRGSVVSTASSAGGTTRRFSLLTSLGHLLHLPAGATPASAVAARLDRSTRDLQADYGLAAFAPTRVRVLLAAPAGEVGSPSDGEGEDSGRGVASEAQQRSSRAAEGGGSIESGVGSASRGDSGRGEAAAAQHLTAASAGVRTADSRGSISHRSGGSVPRPVVPPLAALTRKGVSDASLAGVAGAGRGSPIRGSSTARSSVVVVLRGWTPRDSPRFPRLGYASRAAAAARDTVVTTVAGAAGVSKPASEGFLRSALRAIGRWLPGNDATGQRPWASAPLAGAQLPAATARSVPEPPPAERSLPRRTAALIGAAAELRALPQPCEQGRHTRASHAYPLLANPLHSRTAAAHRPARGGAAAARTRLRAAEGRDAAGAAEGTAGTAAPRPALDIPSPPVPRAAPVPGSPVRLSGARQRLEGSAAAAAAAVAALRPERLSEVRHGGGRVSGLAPARSGSPGDLSGGGRPSLSAPLGSVQRADAWVGDASRSPAITRRRSAASPTVQRPSHAQAQIMCGFVPAVAGTAASRPPTLAAASAAPAVEVLPRAQLSARAAAAALRLYQWHGRGELRAGEEFAGLNPMQARALRLQQPTEAEGGTGLISSPRRRTSVTQWLPRLGVAPQQGHGGRASAHRLSLSGTHKRSCSGPMHAPGAADVTPRDSPSSPVSGRVRVVLSGSMPRRREGESAAPRQGAGQASAGTAQRQLGWRDEPPAGASCAPDPGPAGRQRRAGREKPADASMAAAGARRASLPSPPAPHRSSGAGNGSAARQSLSANRRLGAPTSTPPASTAPPPFLPSLPARTAAAVREGALGLGVSSRRLERAAETAAHAGGPEGTFTYTEAAAAVEPAGATGERGDADCCGAAGGQLRLLGTPAAHGSAGPLNTAGPGGSGERGGMPALDVARRIRDVADVAMPDSPKAEVAGSRVDAGTHL